MLQVEKRNVKKIVFEIEKKENTNLATVIKTLKEFPCRSSFDFKIGFIVINDINDDIIDNLIKLIEENFEVLWMQVDNTKNGQEEAEVCKKEEKTELTKVSKDEEALLEVIGPALEKLDKTKPISEQVDNFMKEIEMISHANLIKVALNNVCNIKKISYEFVVIKLRELNPTMSIYDIRDDLKQQFKFWLSQNPKLAKSASRINLMHLLKLFAKRFEWQNC